MQGIGRIASAVLIQVSLHIGQVLHDAFRLVAIEVADGEAFLHTGHVTGVLRKQVITTFDIVVFIVHLSYLILIVGHIQVDAIREVLANLVVPVQGQFPSPALHFSQVGVRHGEAQQPRSRSVNQQNVFTVLTVIVHRSTETVVKEIHVDTIVLFQGCFPTHIGIVLGGFSCSQTDCTVFNTKAVSVSAVTVRQTAVIHFIRVGQVKETEVQVARLIVTYQTQAGTQFQECHPRLQRLEPFFLTHNPSHRTCREGTEAAFRRKVLGTVVTDVELGHVTVFPVVGHTSYQTYIPTGNVTVLRATAAKVILLGLVVGV